MVAKLSMYNKTKNRGLAFVSMGSPEEALTALKNLESYVSILDCKFSISSGFSWLLLKIKDRKSIQDQEFIIFIDKIVTCH